MAYQNPKPYYGVSIEMKGKGSTSLLPTDGQDYYYSTTNNDQDDYYSTLDDADNTIVTARTPSVQQAIPNRIRNQHTENVISDSQIKSRLDTMNDNINLLKKKNNRLKTGLIISLFVIFVAIGAVSATAVIFKQNLEDSLKRKTETQLASTNEARGSEGNWTHWSNWDACSATCNVGVRRRTRTCNGIGQDGLIGTCSGSDFDISICNDKDCTTQVPEYSWTHWLNWGTCSVTCDVGVRRRTRTCNGISQDGLLGTCSGNDLDISTCNDKDCTRSNWAQWLNWGACSTTCNAGVRIRKRTCNSQYGQQRFCLGTDVDISICNNDECTRSNWALWLNWGACSTTCNAGVRRRKRTCRSFGQYGQQGFCLGNDVDISTCNNDECTQEPGPSDVSFSSYLKYSLTNVKIGTTVVFDGVDHTAGNAYNSSTGVFTCPTAGTYLFSITVSAFNNKTTNFCLYVNDICKSITVSEPAINGHDSTGTAVLVYPLNIDQRVCVKTYNTNNTDIYKVFTHFVGVLIHR